MPMPIRRWTFSNCARLAIEPTLLSGSVGSPTFSAATVAAAMATTCSCRWRGTSIRVGATQVWPELIMQLTTPSETAARRSASSRITLADLPPSSWSTRLTVPAAAAATSIPARVEPVIEITSTSPWRDSAAPTVGPSP
ncbi:hypothetical protein D3C81_1465150 [compost metagenome]